MFKVLFYNNPAVFANYLTAYTRRWLRALERDVLAKNLPITPNYLHIFISTKWLRALIGMLK